MPQNVIEFNRQELSNLKRSYTVAKKNGKEQFKFKENDVLVSYAKYLIEYLETRLV